MILLALLLLFPCVSRTKISSTSSISHSDYGEIKLFQTPAVYDVDTTVLLNDADRKDQEIGYKIKAILKVEAVWDNGESEYLLKFELISPKLHLRGKHINAEFLPHPSIWDSHRSSIFYAHWKSGLILTAYLNPNDPLDVLNFKKSLLSLFQFQVIDGEEKETDISGACEILYETLSMHIVRKIKRRCSWEGSASEGEGVSTRRVSRYELSDALDALQAVHAEEVHEAGGAGAALKVRAWTRLARRPPPTAPSAPPTPPARPLHAALAALPADTLPLPLTLSVAEDDSLDDTSLESALEQGRAALEGDAAGAGGGVREARSLLALLPALRAAPADRLLALLRRDNMHHLLPGLCRALGAAGTSAAHAAVREFLQLRARDPLVALAREYLAAAALAERPAAAFVRELLVLGEEARSAAVVEGALLAAAAAAARSAPELALHVRDALAKGLARCKDEECRVTRLTALGNLRREDTAELLLSHAERGSRAEAVAALSALTASPAAALSASRLDRLAAVASATRAPHTLEVRAAALDLLLLRLEASPLAVARLAATLRDRGPHELRRLFWQRLHSRAVDSKPVRDLLAALHPTLKNWDAQAHAGTSSVLVRHTGWETASGAWRAQLESVQLAARGLLRRGRVRLLALAPDNTTHSALAVELWTRGLDAFASGDGPEGGRSEGDPAGEEGTSGGLVLTVGGARMPGITLFEGQAELLSHVWSGAGSEPTPVLRALQPLPAHGARLPLLTGAALRVRWRSALAYALDAQVQVSLWSRTAHTELRLRAAASAVADARLHTAWGEMSARATADAEPRMSIAADLDFYDRVALCVRVRLADHEVTRNTTLSSRQGARQLRVRRSREVLSTRAGRTLSLGALNDAACRTLGASDAHDEDAP